MTPSEVALLLEANPVAAGVVRSIVASGRVSNAYLFKGPRGAAKDVVALEFAKALLCDRPAGGTEEGVEETRKSWRGCGKCWSCRAVEDNSHPDLSVVEKEGNTIKIQTSHEVLQEAVVHPYHSRRKVFIIKDAEDLTDEASNALLKILEEPPPFVTFILTAENIRAIPETIVSRCQMLPFRKIPAPILSRILLERGFDEGSAKEAAEHCDGSLERAMRILERDSQEGLSGSALLSDLKSNSPVDLAMKYAKLDPKSRMNALLAVEIALADDLRSKIGSGDLQATSGQRATSSWSEIEGQVRRLYLALCSLLEAEDRLSSNTSAFLTFSVLFFDLAHLLPLQVSA